jgi:hypothetical protein
VIPLPELGVELVLGVGAALFVGNLAALIRPVLLRRTSGRKVPSPPSPGRVVFNMMAGLAIAVWALATLVVRG